MAEEQIIRTALGRSAYIGDLYNARRDEFIGMNLFKKEITEGAISMLDDHFTDLRFVHEDNYSEKFSKLNVNAELQASVLGGWLQLEGSGRYLNDYKTSARSVNSSLIYSIRTKKETLNAFYDGLKNAYSIDAISSNLATHAVVGIWWGANTILTCKCENSENRDTTELSGKLHAYMNKATLSINGKANVDTSEGANSINFKIDLRIFGDIVNLKDELPTTMESALRIIKNVPALISTCNNGKGKPLSYGLLPLGVFRKALQITTQVDTTIRLLEESSLVRVVQLFDAFSAAQQKFNDFYTDANNYHFCIMPNILQDISSWKNKLQVEETKIRSKFASILISVRSGKANASDIELFIKDFHESVCSAPNIISLLERWSSVRENIAFVASLNNAGVKYIGLGASLDAELIKDYNKKFVVLYFSSNSHCDMNVWTNNRQLFLKSVQEYSAEQVHLAVDLDLHPKLAKRNISSFVQVIQGGEILVEDMLAEYTRDKLIPMVRYISGTVRVQHKPNMRVSLSIACSGENCNPSTVYEWSCQKCKNKVEYGFDQHVYCSCGKTPSKYLEFKCTDLNHGVAYVPHKEYFLQELIASMRPIKEMNILILGETGVGKSTWINAFANFLRYESLDDAVSDDLISLIHSKFTLTDENYEPIEVITGTDSNEIMEDGQSATQAAKVYSFTVEDTNVNLIDTPGVGDVRGLDQDKINFQNILGVLSNFEEIHGICILLMPNSSKLNVTFRFCIKELLTYLHRDACQNIMFCFTNTRGTCYRPGETVTPLKALLRENQYDGIAVSRHTMYCYDSEAYRFLAAIKNKRPITFTDEERRSFSKSWDISSAEVKRMLQHIEGLKPHVIKSTLNLHHCRQLIVKLSRPLTEITANIQCIKAQIQIEIEEIYKTNARIEDLKKIQKIKRPFLESTRVDHPKTVCTDAQCVVLAQLHNKNENSIFYKSICHNPCTLENITEDAVGHPGLIKCWAIDESTGNCRVCGHHYSSHMHSWYDSEQVEREVEDNSVTEDIRRNVSAAEIKNNMIANRKKEIQEYEDELLKIEEACVHFAHFLKSNAITYYNDATELYLEKLIKAEEEMVNRVKGHRREILDNLNNSLDRYRRQKIILDQNLSRSHSAFHLEATDVETWIDELKNLKHSGKFLKDALDCVEQTKQYVYQASVVHTHPIENPSNLNQSKKAVGKPWYRKLF